jgi:hypothetical protein
MIEFDETEFFDDGLTAGSLMAISSLLGEEVAILLYGVVVPINVHPIRVAV